MDDITAFSKSIPDSCSVLQICCTNYNTFVVTTSGRVYSWGDLTYELGRKPKQEKDLQRPMPLNAIREVNILNLACGTNHVLGLSIDRTIYSWGENNFGQLGHGDQDPRPEPTLIKDLERVVRISAGNEYSFALIEKMVDGAETYVTFAWGNNNNIKLRKVNSEDQVASVSAVKVLQPAWGTYNPNVSIKPDKRGHNYAYKSVQGNEIDLGSLTKADVLDIETENDHLKRRLQILTKKMSEYEKQVYGSDVSLHTGGLENDRVYENIKKILVITSDIEKNRSILVEKKKAELSDSNKEIENIESVLKEQYHKELQIREDIEKDEDEIRFMSLKFDKFNLSEVKNDVPINKLRTEVIRNTAEYNKLCDEKVRLQKQMLDQHEKSQTITLEINCLKQEIKEARTRTKILKNIKKIRKEQLIYNFFEQSQKGINKEIDNFQSIFEAVSDTEIESLSKSIQKLNLNEYLQYSNLLLSHLKVEVSVMEKPGSSNFVYKELNKFWKVMDKHISLQTEKNCLMSGLLQEVVCEVCKEKHRSEDDAEREVQRKLMKKILSKANMNNFQGTFEE